MASSDSSPTPPDYDVLIVGAGLAGLFALHKVRAMGLTARVFEAAPDVGGVWYWNRYPGARCDVESLQYSYSFSKELEQEWVWTEKYSAQPEILAYIRHVAERFDLRRDITFETRIATAHFNDAAALWALGTSAGPLARGRYLIMASGSLSAPNLPEIPGIRDFAGRVLHTGAWPTEPVDFAGRRVGVIGTGSSGIQAITALGKLAGHLTVFQRTANFSVPAWNIPMPERYQTDWKNNYGTHRANAREVGTLYEFSSKGAMQVSAEEREAEFERRWAKGGVNLVHAFNDLLINPESNAAAAEFVRRKIRGIVTDPVVAEALCPKDHPIGTKRICVDTGYYETYNRPNVRLVDLKQTPITRIDAGGVHTADAAGNTTYHALDDLVCATGFDALTGALTRIDIRGRDGLRLTDKWAAGPRTLLGIMTRGFPNLFVITGAGSPSALVNMVVGIEHHVEWITDCIAWLRARGVVTIDAGAEAEDRWVERVNAAATATLLMQANSWFLGANVPGKPRVFMLYVAKIGAYRKECQAIADAGYAGFELQPPPQPEPVAGTTQSAA